MIRTEQCMIDLVAGPAIFVAGMAVAALVAGVIVWLTVG